MHTRNPNDSTALEDFSDIQQKLTQLRKTQEEIRAYLKETPKTETPQGEYVPNQGIKYW